MDEFEYDAVVVGGGPGGSMAAKTMAEKGLEVLILEKRAEIGVPVRCGEGLAKDLLAMTGIKPDKRWIDNEADGARIFAPDESIHIAVDQSKAGAETGYVVDRGRMDKHLAALAVKAGSDLWLKTPALGIEMEDGEIAGNPNFKYHPYKGGRPVAVIARHEGKKLRIKTKIIIGADGVESHVARWTGIHKSLAAKDIISGFQYRMVNIEVDPKWVDFYSGQKIAPEGYIWCFPKGENEANIGIGMHLNSVKRRGEAKRYLDKWIDNHDWCKNGRAVHIMSGGVPVAQPPEHTIADRVLLVGDAAKVSDAMTGGGIAHAMLTGLHAGTVAAEAVEAKDTGVEVLAKYEKLWREELEDKLWRNWMAKEKFLQFEDDTLNKMIGVVMEVDLKEITTYNLIKAVVDKYPKLAQELEDFM